jgi:LacI family transcriptional regulator/LacI family asc operon transcriptional repressor
MKNIYDIAKMSGVSIATVSRVINGSDRVSAKTREKVLKVIEEEGYSPNVFAQGLGLKTMHMVGIMVPVITDIYMSMAVYYLEEALGEIGYDCLLSCTGFHLEEKEAHTNMLIEKHMDALIYVGSTYAGKNKSRHETDYIREAAEKVPVFIINGAVDGENIWSTVSEDFKVVHSAVTSLIKSGRKNILFLSDSESYSARQKLAGYEAALTDAGLPVRGEYRLHLRNDNIHYVRDVLLSHRDLNFDAAVAAADSIALGVLKYSRIRGLKVPEDLSIIGYNNSVLAIGCDPEITSIDNHIEDACRITVKRMNQVLQGNKDLDPSVIVPCTLYKRCTTDF